MSENPFAQLRRAHQNQPQQQTEQPTAEEGGFFSDAADLAQDLGASFAQGAGSSVTNLAGFAAGALGAKNVQNELYKQGELTGRGATNLMSEDGQQASEAGYIDSIKEGNWGTLARKTLQDTTASVPGMILTAPAGALAGKALGKVTSGLTGRTGQFAQKHAGSTGQAIAEGADMGINAHAGAKMQVLGKTHEELSKGSPEYNSLYQSKLEAGLSEEEAQAAAKEELAGSIANQSALKTGVAGAALGLFSPVNKALDKMAGEQKGAVKDWVGFAEETGKATVQEMAQEASQTAAETMLGNVAQQRADENVKITEGLAEAMVGGALSGGLLGGAMTAATTRVDKQAAEYLEREERFNTNAATAASEARNQAKEQAQANGQKITRRELNDVARQAEFDSKVTQKSELSEDELANPAPVKNEETGRVLSPEEVETSFRNQQANQQAEYQRQLAEYKALPKAERKNAQKPEEPQKLTDDEVELQATIAKEKQRKQLEVYDQKLNDSLDETQHAEAETAAQQSIAELAEQGEAPTETEIANIQREKKQAIIDRIETERAEAEAEQRRQEAELAAAEAEAEAIAENPNITPQERAAIADNAATERQNEQYLPADIQGELAEIDTLIEQAQTPEENATLVQRKQEIQGKIDDIKAKQDTSYLPPEIESINPYAGRNDVEFTSDDIKPLDTTQTPVIEGNTDTATTADNESVDYKWALTDANSIPTRLNTDGTINNKIPQVLHSDDVTGQRYNDAVEQIVENFDPRKLENSGANTHDGAPLINKNTGIADSGDKVVHAIKRLNERAKQGDETAQQKVNQYVESVKKQAESRGIPPQAIDDMVAQGQVPMLSRMHEQPTGDMGSYGAFQHRLDQPNSTAKSRTRDAQVIAESMSDEVMAALDAKGKTRAGTLDSAVQDGDFEEAVKNALGEKKFDELRNRAGKTGQDFIRIGKAGILQHAYQDPELADMYMDVHRDGTEMSNIADALVKSAIPASRTRAKLKQQGRDLSEFDGVVGSIKDAVKLVRESRKNRKKGEDGKPLSDSKYAVRDYLEDHPDIDPAVAYIADFMSKNMRSEGRMREALRDMYEALEQSAEQGNQPLVSPEVLEKMQHMDRDYGQGKTERELVDKLDKAQEDIENRKAEDSALLAPMMQKLQQLRNVVKMRQAAKRRSVGANATRLENEIQGLEQEIQTLEENLRNSKQFEQKAKDERDRLARTNRGLQNDLIKANERANMLASGSNTRDIKTPNMRSDEKIRVEGQVTDADNVIASNNPDGSVNPDFQRLAIAAGMNKELQPRDRTTKDSREQVDSFADKGLDIEMLLHGYNPAQGADGSPVAIRVTDPLDGKDKFLVIAGNGRTMGIKKTYRDKADRANAYKEYLNQNADKLGGNPEQPLDQPMFVREIKGYVRNGEFTEGLSEAQLKHFSYDSNVSDKKIANIAEDASALVTQLDAKEVWMHFSPSLAADGGTLFTKSNDRFLVELAKAKGGPISSYQESDGEWSAEFKNLARAVVFQKAYGDYQLTREMFGRGAESGMKNFFDALINASPTFVLAENAREQNNAKNTNTARYLREAIGALVRYDRSLKSSVTGDQRFDAESVAAFVDTRSFIDDDASSVSPEARGFVDFLVNNRKSKAKLQQGITAAARASWREHTRTPDTGTPEAEESDADMFGGGMFGDMPEQPKLEPARDSNGRLLSPEEFAIQEVGKLPAVQRRAEKSQDNQNNAIENALNGKASDPMLKRRTGLTEAQSKAADKLLDALDSGKKQKLSDVEKYFYTPEEAYQQSLYNAVEKVPFLNKQEQALNATPLSPEDVLRLAQDVADGKREMPQPITAEEESGQEGLLKRGKTSKTGDSESTTEEGGSQGKQTGQRRTAASPTRRYTAAELRAEVETISKNIAQNVDLHIAQTPDDLPFKAPSDTKGAYYKGQVWLVADNITSRKDMQSTLAHEAIGHFAMETVFANEFDTIIQQTQQLMQNPRGEIASVLAEVDSTQPDLDPVIRAKEVIAHLSERGIKIPLVKRATARIARFMRSLGFNLPMSTAELQGLLSIAGQRIEGARGLYAESPNFPLFARRRTDTQTMGLFGDMPNNAPSPKPRRARKTSEPKTAKQKQAESQISLFGDMPKQYTKPVNRKERKQAKDNLGDGFSQQSLDLFARQARTPDTKVDEAAAIAKASKALAEKNDPDFSHLTEQDAVMDASLFQNVEALNDYALGRNKIATAKMRRIAGKLLAEVNAAKSDAKDDQSTLNDASQEAVTKPPANADGNMTEQTQNRSQPERIVQPPENDTKKLWAEWEDKQFAEAEEKKAEIKVAAQDQELQQWISDNLDVANHLSNPTDQDIFSEIVRAFRSDRTELKGIESLSETALRNFSKLQLLQSYVVLANDKTMSKTRDMYQPVFDDLMKAVRAKANRPQPDTLLGNHNGIDVFEYNDKSYGIKLPFGVKGFAAKKNAIKEMGATWDRVGKNWIITKKKAAQLQEIITAAANDVKPSPSESKGERQYLDVPFSEKDAAKALGARWDGRKKQWYFAGDALPDGLQKFQQANETAKADDTENVDIQQQPENAAEPQKPEQQASQPDTAATTKNRVEAEVSRLNNEKGFTPEQRKWVNRIGNQAVMQANNNADFDADFVNNRFSSEGGVKRLDNILGGQLQDVINQISSVLAGKQDTPAADAPAQPISGFKAVKEQKQKLKDAISKLGDDSDLTQVKNGQQLDQQRIDRLIAKLQDADPTVNFSGLNEYYGRNAQQAQETLQELTGLSNDYIDQQLKPFLESKDFNQEQVGYIQSLVEKAVVTGNIETDGHIRDLFDAGNREKLADIFNKINTPTDAQQTSESVETQTQPVTEADVSFFASLNDTQKAKIKISHKRANPDQAERISGMSDSEFLQQVFAAPDSAAMSDFKRLEEIFRNDAPTEQPQAQPASEPVEPQTQADAQPDSAPVETPPVDPETAKKLDYIKDNRTEIEASVAISIDSAATAEMYKHMGAADYKEKIDQIEAKSKADQSALDNLTDEELLNLIETNDFHYIKPSNLAKDAEKHDYQKRKTQAIKNTKLPPFDPETQANVDKLVKKWSGKNGAKWVESGQMGKLKAEVNNALTNFIGAQPQQNRSLTEAIATEQLLKQVLNQYKPDQPGFDLIAKTAQSASRLIDNPYNENQKARIADTAKKATDNDYEGFKTALADLAGLEVGKSNYFKERDAQRLFNQIREEANLNELPVSTDSQQDTAATTDGTPERNQGNNTGTTRSVSNGNVRTNNGTGETGGAVGVSRIRGTAGDFEQDIKIGTERQPITKNYDVRLKDYQITDADELGKGGLKTKFKQNVAAIRLLKDLMSSYTNPGQITTEQQAILAKYTGWGAMPGAFKDVQAAQAMLDNGEITPEEFKQQTGQWGKEAAEMQQMIDDGILTQEEYEAARRSTQYAHYTSPEIVKFMWQSLAKMGFTGGKILDPSMGTGNFEGLMPKDIHDMSKVTGVEVDPITANIARYLYPGASVQRNGFEKINFTENSFDLAISNPPFSSTKLFDKNNKDISKFSMHNYFFAKSLKSVKPGGIVAMVVSNSLMDAKNSEAREWLSERADLVGAIRLPNNAFAENAGTAVTTDIIFLRKRIPGEEPKGADWTGTTEIDGYQTDDNGNRVPVKIPINQYFADNPQNLAGEMTLDGSMYRDGQPALVAPKEQNTAAVLDEIAQDLIPENIIHESKESQSSVAEAAETEAYKRRFVQAPEYDMTKPYGLLITSDGKVAQRISEGEMYAEPDSYNTKFGQRAFILEGFDEKKTERVKRALPIRDKLRELMNAEISGKSETKTDALRRELNDLYDDFVYGQRDANGKRIKSTAMGSFHSRANAQIMRSDPDFPLLLSLEQDYQEAISRTVANKNGITPRDESFTKSDIFSKRVLAPREQITSTKHSANPEKDGLMVSLSESGVVDINRIAELSGKTPEAVIEKLTDEGVIFNDPDSEQEFSTADAYLSGNVKKKLKRAEELGLTQNAAALREVLPPDISATDIDIKLSSGWMPPKHAEAFMKHLLGDNADVTAFYEPALAKWTVTGNKANLDDSLSNGKWGTPEKNTLDLVQSIMDNRPVVVYKPPDAEGKRAVNTEATEAAMEKAIQIRDAFQDWIYKDDDRRRELEQIYNEVMNTNVNQKYDGSHLTFEGMNQNIELRQHQKDAVWRIVQDGKGLLDHVVGAGKTFAAIAAGMEMKRMGLVQKPMYAVPNHLVGQWAEDFKKLYPNAKVLAATPEDFAGDKRREMIAKIATGEWDAVVLAHSTLGKIKPSPESEQEVIYEELAQIEEALRRDNNIEGSEKKGKDPSVKQLEKRREALQNRLDKIKDREQDDVLTFDQTGIDHIFVDESHEFKRLFFSTGMHGISGIGDQNGSKKAFDLYAKVRELQRNNNGRGTVFLTGTPVSNTMVEMYTIQRYLQYSDLKEKSLQNFDAWANTFGNISNEYELDATGMKFKPKTRFRNFTNLPELMQMYSGVADTVTQQNLKDQQAAEGKRWPVPNIKGGKPENVIVKPSDAVNDYMEEIIHRAENIPQDKREDNMLKITNDARKAGLDMRLIDPELPDNPDSKVNKCADSVLDTYHQWDKEKGTQLVFCDLSTPKSGRSSAVNELWEKVEKARATDKNGDYTEAALEMQEKLESASPDELAGMSLEQLLEPTTTRQSISDVMQNQFSVYEDLKQKLIDRGIPENEIAFIHDYNTQTQKQKLFQKVNNGEIRVLLGSTFKMGAGMNVQKRLVALHHLDAPWRPSDIEQREGRIIRQGNEFFARDPDGFEVDIKRYATEKTYDARMWQTLETKAKFIEQLKNGDTSMRQMEDIAGQAATMAEMKAAATGNPLILADVELANELRKAQALKRAREGEIHKAKDRVNSLEKTIVSIPKQIGSIQQAISQRDSSSDAVKIAGTQYKDQKAAGNMITDQFKGMVAAKMDSLDGFMSYKGFNVSIVETGSKLDPEYVLEIDTPYGVISSTHFRQDTKSGGITARLNNMLSRFDDDLANAEKRLTKAKTELPTAQAQASLDNPYVAQVQTLRRGESLMNRLIKSEEMPREYKDAEQAAMDNKKSIDKAGYAQLAKTRAQALLDQNKIPNGIHRDALSMAIRNAETDPETIIRYESIYRNEYAPETPEIRYSKPQAAARKSLSQVADIEAAITPMLAKMKGVPVRVVQSARDLPC